MSERRLALMQRNKSGTGRVEARRELILKMVAD